MSTEENKAIMRRWVDEWNKGNLDAVYALYSEDYVDHNAPPGVPQGMEGLRIGLGAFHNAFPDLQITLEHLIAEGDKVVDHGVSRGTHKGDLFGIPPTGKRVEFTFTDIHRVANGKLVEAWHLEDLVSVMQQIGVMPAPGQ